MVKLELFGHDLPNPIIASSGTFGYGFDQCVDIGQIGAVTIKSLTVNPRDGNPPPRIAEVGLADIIECFYPVSELANELGFVNFIGLQNVGIREFVEEYALQCHATFGRYIFSIAGDSIEEYAYLAQQLEQFGDWVMALEVNISCPNVKKGLVFGTDPDMTYEVTKAAKKASAIPIVVKLTPNIDDICTIAQAAISAGAEGLSLINTIKVRVRTRDGKEIAGGLSGPMISPIAQRLVQQVCQSFPNVPIIAGGGVWNAEDVSKMLSLGATAVSVGTLNFTRPDAILKLISDFESLR